MAIREGSIKEHHRLKRTWHFIHNSSLTFFNHKAIRSRQYRCNSTQTPIFNSCGVWHKTMTFKMKTRLRLCKMNMRTTSITFNDPTIHTRIHVILDGETTQIFLGVATTMSWSPTTFNNSNVNHYRRRNKTWMKHWRSFQQAHQLLW